MSPSGLCFTSERNIVVIDRMMHRVQIVREDGTFVRAFGSKGSGDGEFQCMIDVCSSADGSIAVLDDDAHRVQVFDGEGVFLRSFGSEGRGPGQFERPVAIAAGRGGEIIVSDGRRKDVQIFSPEGELLGTVAFSKSAPCCITGVAVTTGEVMFISSSPTLFSTTLTVTTMS